MSFEKAIAFILRPDIEGVFSDDPTDPGNWTGGAVGKGELRGTKYGISARAYPILDIRNLTQDQAIDIYRSAYWNEIQGDSLPEPWDVMLFDSAVNQGVPRAVKTLQASLRVTADGVVGPETISALQRAPSAAVSLYLADRLLAYSQTLNFDHNGRGWFRRVVDLARAI